MRAFLAVLPLLLAAPAAGQQTTLPPQGIGFAQAEEGTWLCRHEDPLEALGCARELCAEQALGQECVATAWCFPARWSGLMTIRLPDFHTTQALCGAPNEAALNEALAALCKGNETASGCDLVNVIDPEGIERAVQGVSFPGGATATPGDGTAPETPADGGEEDSGTAADAAAEGEEPPASP